VDVRVLFLIYFKSIVSREKLIGYLDFYDNKRLEGAIESFWRYIGNA